MNDVEGGSDAEGDSDGESDDSCREVDCSVGEGVEHVFLAFVKVVAEVLVGFEDVVGPPHDEPLDHNDHDELDVVEVGVEGQEDEPCGADDSGGDEEDVGALEGFLLVCGVFVHFADEEVSAVDGDHEDEAGLACELDVVVAEEVGGEPVNEVVGEGLVAAYQQNVVAGRRIHHPVLAGLYEIRPQLVGVFGDVLQGYSDGLFPDAGRFFDVAVVVDHSDVQHHAPDEDDDSRFPGEVQVEHLNRHQQETQHSAQVLSGVPARVHELVLVVVVVLLHLLGQGRLKTELEEPEEPRTDQEERVEAGRVAVDQGDDGHQEVEETHQKSVCFELADAVAVAEELVLDDEGDSESDELEGVDDRDEEIGDVVLAHDVGLCEGVACSEGVEQGHS